VGGVILLTGGTGFLGSCIARRLLKETEHRIVALVRAAGADEARNRLLRAWRSIDPAGLAARVRAVPADLALPDLGLDPQAYRKLVCEVTHVIHAAADLRLDGPLQELRRTNVGGTASLLALARAAHRDHGLERFSHVSTAYVAGGRGGEVAEEELTDAWGFSNAYERTKYEGELLVREAMRELPATVFRPGIVVGDSATGEIACFNTVYVPLKLYLYGKLKLIPARPGMRVNMVPVDHVTDGVFRLTFDPRAEGLTFHLTVDPQLLPTARELLETAGRWAGRRLDLSVGRPRFIPLELLARRAATAGRLPRSLVSYFGENRRFLRENTDRLLGPYAPRWAEILPRLLDYAARRGFLHRTERTVHEQILFRLQSRRLPVRLHDIVDGRIEHRSGTEAAADILSAVGALRRLGICPGDRVALVGLNSSRYPVLDTAVGLAGAVSVPLYCTSPIPEILEILGSSGARLLFVGAQAVLERLEPGSSLPIVSFSRYPVPAPLGDRVLSWEAFLALGRAAGPVPGKAAPRTCRAPVCFDSPATLRYSSGTTGRPKAAAFTHGQLLWMAETTASLLPWKARIRPARYLSFLPLNHVVEGILGAYAPYSVPAPVDMYYLEDFHGLAAALPRVRPTIFFSVPRFYEKVWERFSSGLPARVYRSLPPGRIRSLMRPLLRAALLRKTGLDRCAQLIAGSAPCSEALLRSYGELGIQIHNAYGLTEAPLVALNRAGDNRPGTVGRPLPDTEVRTAPDGEILVRGPQTAAPGWLATGDLGALDAEGRLVILGRRKEVLVTSYGKNILPAKLEALLREIPGVGDAMLVGDGRPYVTALIWSVSSPFDAVDAAVRRLNDGLSGPERVKRWAVLENAPDMDSGELTCNLKIRRQAVLARRRPVVELLYGEPGGGAAAGGVLHFGADLRREEPQPARKGAGTAAPWRVA
jgi:long-chain acyl-CoA synthetase